MALIKTVAVLLISILVSAIITGITYKWNFTEEARQSFDTMYLACIGTAILFQLFWMQE